jgi:hypothetical protein
MRLQKTLEALSFSVVPAPSFRALIERGSILLLGAFGKDKCFNDVGYFGGKGAHKFEEFHGRISKSL